MKRFQTVALFGMLAAQVGIASAATSTGPTSLTEFPQRWLPVLVNVDAKGNVTDVSPSTHLTPQFDRLLRQNLDELITGPATDGKGHAVSSQFIMNVVLKTTPRNQDTYDANFAYLSTSPVPPGSWYWVHINGHRLALASRSTMFRGQRNYFEQSHPNGTNAPPGWQGYKGPVPSFQSPSHSSPAPAAVPASGRGH